MLAVITLVFVFFFRLNGVSGSSMYPTLVDKDYLVLESNFLYRDAKQGDIVVLYTPPFSENDAETDAPTITVSLPIAVRISLPLIR